MKKLLLLSVLFFAMGELFAQYQGQPWAGTPWAFGTDAAANLKVGENWNWKKTTYNGIPHYAYDIGVVDTLLKPSADPNGSLVAGSGYNASQGNSGWLYRIDEAAANSITLNNSDIAAINSPNFGGPFSSHNNRAVFGGNGAWYRYTCSFAEGNYKMVLRTWGRNTVDHAFWIRFYDKATMNPLTPWTRHHPGSGGGDAGLMEEASYVDITQEPFASNIHADQPAQAEWIELSGEFSLNGEVVLEFSDVGPTDNHPENRSGSGSGCLGEITFIHTGAISDKLAPVANVWKDSYDDMEVISLKLSEDGTLYLVPDSTAVEDLETANIDKMEMTTSSTYTKAVNELNLDETIQIVTLDAAGNSRYTAPITFQAALRVDKTQGNTGDTLFVNTTRAGFVALVPADVNGDYVSLMNAIAAGTADTVNVTGGADTLVITNLTGDMNCNVWLFDLESGEISNPIAFQLGEGGGNSVAIKEQLEVSVAAFRNEIIVRNTDNYNYLRIYDILGKEHIRQAVNTNIVNLDAGAMNGGVYILKLSGDSGVVTKKFLLRK